MSETMAHEAFELLPHWVPKEARTYLEHTEAGTPIRALARAAGVHASTVLRQVRALEARREDLLVDRALERLRRCVTSERREGHGLSASPGTARPDGAVPAKQLAAHDHTSTPPAVSEEMLGTEARRVLAKLMKPDAVLAVAADMDKAVVVRDTAAGDTVRSAVVDRDLAEIMALNNWIACQAPGRVSRYRITPAGRAELNRMLARAESLAVGGAPDMAISRRAGGSLRRASEMAGSAPEAERRYHAPETPLSLLARRRDRTGARFLSKELVATGRRFQEDYEMAGLKPRPDQSWEAYLVAAMDGHGDGCLQHRGAEAARVRIVGALRDLGPGLGDVALRCCCYLEGMETIEERMGWSARSGKVVLRIALQRLRLYYKALGDAGHLIG